MRLHPTGKLIGRQKPICAAVEKLVASQSATACTVQGVSNFIQLQDQISGRRFLMDTGASLLLLPHKSKNPCSGPPLVSASGSPFRSWGFQRQTVKFGPHAFTFDFLLADMARPILRFDFLRAHHLNVSPSAGLLRFTAGTRPGEPPITVAATIPPPPPHLLRSAPKYCRKYLQIFNGC